MLCRMTILKTCKPLLYIFIYISNLCIQQRGAGERSLWFPSHALVTYTNFQPYWINICHGTIEDGKNKRVCSQAYNFNHGLQTWPECTGKVASAERIQIIGWSDTRGSIQKRRTNWTSRGRRILQGCRLRVILKPRIDYSSTHCFSYILDSFGTYFETEAGLINPTPVVYPKFSTN